MRLLDHLSMRKLIQHSGIAIIATCLGSTAAYAKPKSQKYSQRTECRLQHSVGNISVRLIQKFSAHRNGAEESQEIRYTIQTTGDLGMYSNIRRNRIGNQNDFSMNGELVYISNRNYIPSGQRTLKIWDPENISDPFIVTTNSYIVDFPFAELMARLPDSGSLKYEMVAPDQMDHTKMKTYAGSLDISDRGEIAKVVNQSQQLMYNIASDSTNQCSYEYSDQGFRLVSYDCGVRSRNGADHYVIDNKKIYWRRDLEDNVKISLSFGYVPGQSADRTNLLPAAGQRLPMLWVDFDKKWGAKNGYNNTKTQLAEFRSGKIVRRDWLPSNSVLGVSWQLLPQFLEQDSDFLITAYDQATGETLRKTVEHGFLEKIKTDLRQAYGEMLEKSRDPINRCKRIIDKEDDPNDYIIVT